MKKFTIITLIFFVLVGVQNGLFEYVRIFGIKPDIILTFIICFTLIRGNPYGTIAGIAGGMIEDIFFGGAFGINSIGCMIAAYVVGILEGFIYKDNIFVPGVFTFAGTLIKELIVFLFLYLTRTNMDIVFALTNIIIPEAIYNSIFAAVFFRYLVKFSNNFLPGQGWRYQ